MEIGRADGYKQRDEINIREADHHAIGRAFPYTQPQRVLHALFIGIGNVVYQFYVFVFFNQYELSRITLYTKNRHKRREYYHIRNLSGTDSNLLQR